MGRTIIKSYTLFRPLRCASHSYNSSTGAVSRSRTTGQRHRQPCDDARTLPAWDPSGYSAIIQADRFSPPPFLVVPGILFGPADPTKLALGSLLSLPPCSVVFRHEPPPSTNTFAAFALRPLRAARHAWPGRSGLNVLSAGSTHTSKGAFARAAYTHQPSSTNSSQTAPAQKQAGEVPHLTPFRPI